MSTWRKIFTTDETIPVANGGTGATSLTVGGVVANAADPQVIEGVEQTSAQILVGQGAGAVPAAKLLSGDVTMNSEGAVTIQTSAVETGMINNSAVTLAKMADSTKGNLITYNTSSDPTHLGVGGDGNVLTADSSTATGLKWATAGSATTITTVNGDAQTGPLPVLFGSALGDNATVFVDEDELQFDPTITFVHLNNTDLGQTDANLASFTDGVGRGALYSKNGFKGDLAGRSTASYHVQVDDTSGGEHHLMMVPSSHVTDAFVEPRRATKVRWDESSDTFTVEGNLNVVGSATQTTIESNTVEIADVSLKLGMGSTDSNQLQGTAGSGVGLFIDNDDAEDRKLARVVYEGYQDSASVLGWRVAQEVDNTASVDAISYGVGVMHVQTAAMSTTGGAADLNIGVGAMAYSTNGDGSLWIQTSLT